MTIVYLVKDFNDESGKVLSLEEIGKLDSAKVYRVGTDINKEDLKPRDGFTAKEIKLMVDFNMYSNLYIQEVYSRASELAEKALQN